jgi:ABC-type proline/glycine betaine transport system permease subunit
LLITLSLVLGLRAAFLLPLDRGAGWLFRLVDDPQTRGPALNGVATVFSIAAVAPATAIALLLQPPLFGYVTVVAIAMTALASLSLVEIVLIGWRRIPYSCSYLPGKRHLTYTVAVLLALYVFFVGIGSMIVRGSLLHPARMLFVGGLLMASFAALRRARLRTLGTIPLEFEDEDPAAVILMPLN